ncbi:MAG TPA: peroxiredoxin [Lapillicoccus sp.]|uniref:peroxiredoxin n=1 Tax=Lapillicoccus sp. TaxID=1909287 RepID=UPI002F932F9F
MTHPTSSPAGPLDGPPVGPPVGPLGVGELAPVFALRNQYGETVSLQDFRGEKNVLVVFFPFAFSGVCTGEFREIREHLEDFEGDDVQVVGISCDPMESIRAWADSEAYFFPLLSDFWPHGRTARDYGVFWEQTGFAIRGTFLVDKAGVIRWTLVNGPGEARDFSGYRTALAELRGTTASV